MSTDRQIYSIDNQTSVIAAYAALRGITISRTYQDSGRSGLTFKGRSGLQQLIADVQDGNIDFEVLLVYDISRWGRFQDTDESAFYEFLCRRRGVKLIYCAEPFENDRSAMSAIFKTMKRVMAAEFSRELSDKAFRGAAKMVARGYRHGGPMNYGLRRRLVGMNGEDKGLLELGEVKSLRTDHIIPAAGPEVEVRTVNRIFERYVAGDKPREIAAALNTDGILNINNRPWTAVGVLAILGAEIYTGTLLYNRTSHKLASPLVDNPKSEWIRFEGAFAGIISKTLFDQATVRRKAIAGRWERAELLEGLERLFRERGYLTCDLIEDDPRLPSHTTFRKYFKSMNNAYVAVGFTAQDHTYVGVNHRLKGLRKKLVEDIADTIRRCGGSVEIDKRHMLKVNKAFSLSLVMARTYRDRFPYDKWIVHLQEKDRRTFTIVVRMDSANEEPRDYYIIPDNCFQAGDIRLTQFRRSPIDGFRATNLDLIYALARAHNPPPKPHPDFV